MNVKKICIIVIIGAAIVCAASLLKNWASTMAGIIPSFPKTAFTSLDDLDFLDEYEVEQEISRDVALTGLEPIESKVTAIKYQGKTYNIYSYVFSSMEEAYKYYSNASGHSQQMVARGLYHIKTEHLMDTRYCAYFENCAFRITCTGYRSFCKFMEWFGAQLPIDICEEFYNDFGQRLPG